MRLLTVSLLLAWCLGGMPKAWAYCWTVSGVQFCDNRESTSQRSTSAVQSGPSEADIAAREAGDRRAKANAFNDEGMAAWGHGEWGIAGEQFRQAHAWNPDSRVIFDNLIMATRKVGLVAMEEGDWEYAATNFSSLLYHQPGSQEFQRLSALANAKRQAARGAFDLNRKGIQAAERGDWKTAVASFQQAANDDPRAPAYARNLATARPKHTAFEFNEQGRKASQDGDWSTALKFFESAAAIDPNEPAYTANISLAQGKAQDQRNTAKVQNDLSTIAEEVRSASPQGELSLGDLPTTADAFGTRKANPQLTPAEKGKLGREASAGEQLKAVERQGGEAVTQDLEPASKTARKGFDDTGTENGDLLRPEKSLGARPSALDQQIPKGARDDKEIQQLQAWYRSLELKKVEKEQLLAELKKQQATSQDPSLAPKIAGLAFAVKRLSADQDTATKSAAARVEVVKKQKLDKGLAWEEDPPAAKPRKKE